MQDVLTAAIEMHRSGQLGPASQLYQKVLAKRTGERRGACICSEFCSTSRGTMTRAVEFIGRAVALRPNSHIYHANSGRSLPRSRAISSVPPAAAALPWRSGRITRKRFATSVRPCRAWANTQSRSSTSAVPWSCRPDFVVAHNNLGIGLRELGRRDEALEHFRRAVELEPRIRPGADQSRPDSP